MKQLLSTGSNRVRALTGRGLRGFLVLIVALGTLLAASASHLRKLLTSPTSPPR